MVNDIGSTRTGGGGWEAGLCRRIALISLAIVLPTALARSAAPGETGRRLVVHEWGTFTALQAADGRALSGINTDDEPVPAFVHQIGGAPVISPLEPQPPLTQGGPTALPAVNLRLETPVIYFHPPDDRPMPIEVRASFRGGWLTQFYPKADARIDGKALRRVADMDRLELSESSVGTLKWAITLNALRPAPPPRTSEHVWLAPRAVRAATLTTERETERFLFYRGIGRRDAAFRVVRHAPDASLRIEPIGRVASFPGGWLLSVRADGTTAFRRVPSGTAAAAATVVPAFLRGSHSHENIARLRAEMKDAIVRDGLFGDEAEALLSTWELSYFRSPGLRLLFVVPRSWTEETLPLEVTVRDGTPVDLVRVMVGRIELTTPEQRALIARIADAPTPNLEPVIEAVNALRRERPEEYKALASGFGDPDKLVVPVPDAYRAYVALGRFRFPLLQDAAREDHPSVVRLYAFITELQIPGRFPRD